MASSRLNDSNPNSPMTTSEVLRYFLRHNQFDRVYGVAMEATTLFYGRHRCHHRNKGNRMFMPKLTDGDFAAFEQEQSVTSLPPPTRFE